jgi:hypothetical protein
MMTLNYLWKILKGPRQGFSELCTEGKVRYAGVLVLSYGIINSLGFLISALKHDYPPPPETLDVWIKTWGEFTMLPFLKIPPENYRLFQAIILIPLALSIWMLMAGTGKLLSLLFQGKASYENYLNLLGFGTFTFLWIAAILDMIYSGFLEPLVVPALNDEFGSLVKGFFLWYPPLEYMLLYGLAGVYNGIGTQMAERWAIWKSVVVGVLTFAWPTMLIAVLLR